jgi:hypothetical protein
MEKACGGMEGIRFDAVKIRLLAEANQAFSDLQQIRDSSLFWLTISCSKSPRSLESHSFVQRDSWIEFPWC